MENSSPKAQTTQKLNKSGEPLPDIGLKWGKTPRNDAPVRDEAASTAPLNANGQPDWENFYSEEEKAKLRAKGINPALKAEMEASKRKAEAKGLWGKLAQTALGGGWIK